MSFASEKSITGENEMYNEGYWLHVSDQCRTIFNKWYLNLYYTLIQWHSLIPALTLNKCTWVPVLISPEHLQQNQTNESSIIKKITCMALKLFIKLSRSVSWCLRPHNFYPIGCQLSGNDDELTLESPRKREKAWVMERVNASVTRCVWLVQLRSVASGMKVDEERR